MTKMLAGYESNSLVSLLRQNPIWFLTSYRDTSYRAVALNTGKNNGGLNKSIKCVFEKATNVNQSSE